MSPDGSPALHYVLDRFPTGRNRPRDGDRAKNVKDHGGAIESVRPGEGKKVRFTLRAGPASERRGRRGMLG